jgi:methylenetetrahydrofolate reductase (NADPH)
MLEPAAVVTTPRAHASLLENVSFEAPPKQILASNSEVGVLARGCRVYVPSLPGAEFSETIAACRILVQQGFCAVPHVPARKIGSSAQVADWLAELRAIGCTDLFLVAGDIKGRAGPYADTLELLDSGVLIDHGFRHLGVAGHPESHPLADAATLADALRIKRDYALSTGTTMWVVTQFVFRAEIFLQWLERHREVIEPMSVQFGFPGPSSLSTLLKYARLCGVASSMRALGKKPSLVSLATHWHPGAMLEAVCHHAEESPVTPLQGCHLFAFGGLKQSVRWLENFKGASHATRTN